MFASARLPHVLGALAAALLVLMACIDVEPRSSPPGDPIGGMPLSPPDDSPTSTGPVPEYKLYPGKDGRTPVRVRWVHQLAAPENFYVVDDVVYVSDECLITLSLSTGDELWRACKNDGNGIFTDGGDQIGPAGPGRIRVWTPWNDDLLIDLEGQAVIERRAGTGDPPHGFTPFPRLRDHTYHLSWMGKMTGGYDKKDRLAWSVRTKGVPAYLYPLGPVATSDGGIIVTSSGLMVSLDYAG